MQENTTIKVVLNEVFKTNFSIFDSYEDIVKKDQIKTISYIETIAKELEINLVDVNLFDILKNNEIIITADNAEINKALLSFDREKYFGTTEEVEIVELNEEQIKNIDVAYSTVLTRKIKARQDEANSNVRSAMDRLRQHKDYMKRAYDLREESKTLQVSDYSCIVEDLKKIANDKRFELLSVSDTGMVNILIKEEIINTYKNSRAGIDLRVNLGMFKIKVNLVSGLDFTVEMHRNNVECSNGEFSGIYHPHLNNSGEICLGNMQELFDENRKDSNIFGMIDVAYSVLTTYNEDNPYISLAEFAQNSQQVQPSGEVLEAPEQETRYQHQECPECEYEHEVTFQPEGVSDYAHDSCPECDYEYEYEYHY